MEHEIFSSYINVAALIAAGILIGMLIGYAFARYGRVSGEGGYSAREQSRVDELQTEYDEYRDRVEEHFRETSVVFQQTTEQYRTLYQQIATGAIELCDPEAVQPILESTRGTAHAATGVSSATAAVSQQQTDDDTVDESLGNALAEMRAEMNELDHAINDLRKDVLDPKRARIEAPAEPSPAPATPPQSRVAAVASKTASWQALADHRPANDSTEMPVADLDAARRRSAGKSVEVDKTADSIPVYEATERSAGSGLTARSSLLFDTDEDASEPELVSTDTATKPSANSPTARTDHVIESMPVADKPVAKPLFKNTERLDRMADTLRRDEKADNTRLVPNPRRGQGDDDTIDFKLDKDSPVVLRR